MSRTIPLATKRWGSGPNRALLLHGILSSAAGWWRVAADLAGAGFEVTAADLRGHGASPEGESMRLEDYRDDVLALADSWDLVLAHSLGGAIAVHAVAVRPGWTSRLILEDPALAILDHDQAMEEFTSPWTKPIDRATIAAEKPRWHPRDIDIKVEALRQVGRDAVVRTVDDNVPYDVRPLLAEVAVPTLMLGADPDYEPLVPPEMGMELAAAHDAIEFVVVEDGSHSMHRDAYDAFWSELDRFLAGAGS